MVPIASGYFNFNLRLSLWACSTAGHTKDCLYGTHILRTWHEVFRVGHGGVRLHSDSQVWHNAGDQFHIHRDVTITWAINYESVTYGKKVALFKEKGTFSQNM